MTKIVVIDDRVSNRNIFTRLAQTIEEGIRTEAYASPNQALAALASSETADLVITDFNMPGMNGPKFITTLRRQSAYEDVPIIVVTAYEDREYRYRALEAGATDFLLNPVDHLEFTSRARNLLMLRRQQKQLAARAASLEQALFEQQATAPIAPDSLVQTYLDAVPAAIYAVDERNRVMLMNEAQERLFGKPRHEVLGTTLDEAFGEGYALRHRVLNEKIMQTGKALPSGRLEIHGQGETARSLVVSKAPIGSDAGVDRILTISVDISELHQRDDAQTGTRLYDPLTTLPNAEYFRRRLDDELARARRNRELLSILLIDLDRFKGINDAFNDGFGDQLLCAVAKRLASKLRATDTIARLRSDEFVVLQAGTKRPEDAAELSRRLNEAFSEPFLVDNSEVHLSASVGITMFPADGKTSEILLKNADLAMYRAKDSGRDCYRFFATEMNIAARRAVTLERELRQALAGDQFLVYYQPQIDIASGDIVGMEALVRWNHPYRGVVAPGEFISLAEDIGLIAPLTAWVLRHSCSQHHDWISLYDCDLQLSVNLSPVQFRERGVELLIERILNETNLEPSRLDIELTENAVIDNSNTATASLRYLNRLGVTLSIDDFGTGYSSLSYVKRLPVQRLKIDRSFVMNLENNNHDD
ncbi:MAG: EAL domain-containing protein, partial [Pseudomonadota bacterium]